MNRIILVIGMLLLILLFALTSRAETLPEKAVHPETGEEGRWIPVWLAQEHLQDEHALETCRAELGNVLEQLAELRLERDALQQAVQAQSDALDEARRLTTPRPVESGMAHGVRVTLALLFAALLMFWKGVVP